MHKKGIDNRAPEIGRSSSGRDYAVRRPSEGVVQFIPSTPGTGHNVAGI